MSKYFNFKNAFNIVLLIWCISIPFKNAVYQISTVLLILHFIIYIIINKDSNHLKELLYKFKKLIFAFSLIILSMTISNFINDVSTTDAWKLELMFILRYALVFIVLIYFYSKDIINKKNLTIFIIISLFIQSSDGIYQSIFGYDFFANNIASLNTGINGAIGNRNTYSFLMGLGFIISFVCLIKKSNTILINSYLSILLATFTFLILFSYSRAVWVALFVGLLIYIVSQSKYLKVKHFIYLLIFLCIVFLIFMNIDSLSNRLEQLFRLNTSSRDKIWLKAIELIKEKPFFGWGLDTWKINGAVNLNGIHNSILEILVFTGVFGLISFLGVLYITIKHIFKNKQWELLFIISFLFITSQFGHSIFKTKIFLSVATILMFYIYSIEIKKENIKNDKKV